MNGLELRISGRSNFIAMSELQILEQEVVSELKQNQILITNLGVMRVGLRRIIAEAPKAHWLEQSLIWIKNQLLSLALAGSY